MVDVKKLAEELVNLTVKEVNELATVLKEEYGIEPAAAAVAVAAPAAGAGEAAAAEKTSFDVILKNASFHIEDREKAAIVGINGAGKSTLLKAMLGLLTVISGSVKFYIDHHLAMDKNDYKKIAYVPQSGSVDWDFPTTVLDVVLMGRYGHLGWFKRPSKRDKELALSMIEKMGMSDYVDRQIRQLSGGQQQRVFLARALVQEADIYLMDEPFKGVDKTTEHAIISLLQEMKARGKTVIVVHHDLNTVPQYFDWVTMVNKQTIAYGPVGDTFTDEAIERTYGKGRIV